MWVYVRSLATILVGFALLIDPSGRATGKAEVVSSGTGRFFAVESPAAGRWRLRVRVSASAPLSVRARGR
jgi:hypothetical protein